MISLSFFKRISKYEDTMGREFHDKMFTEVIDEWLESEMSHVSPIKGVITAFAGVDPGGQ